MCILEGSDTRWSRREASDSAPVRIPAEVRSIDFCRALPATYGLLLSRAVAGVVRAQGGSPVDGHPPPDAVSRLAPVLDTSRCWDQSRCPTPPRSRGYRADG